jgi:hypothetical protein
MSMLYEMSAPVFTARLKNLAHILEKGEAFATARGYEPALLLEARLAPDMFPLKRQIWTAADFAKNTMARLAGRDPVKIEDVETSIPDMQARIARTLELVAGFSAADLQGAEDREIVFKTPRGMEFKFNGITFLRDFALPNFYFHATTAYAILRASGVELGKMDFLSPR